MHTLQRILLLMHSKKLMLYVSLSLLGESTEDSRKYTGRSRIMTLTHGKFVVYGMIVVGL